MSHISDVLSRCEQVRSGIFTGSTFAGKDGKKWIKGTFCDGSFCSDVFDAIDSSVLSVPWCGSIRVNAVVVRFGYNKPASIDIVKVEGVVK